MPTISVIISYASQLRDFQYVLQGYEAQYFKDFEIIVVQDHNDEQDLSELISLYPTLNINHVIFEKPTDNWHLYSKLNAGIKASQADFIVIAGDDIMPHKDYLNFYYSQREYDTILCSTKFDIWRHNDKELPSKMMTTLIDCDFMMWSPFNNEGPMRFTFLSDEIELKDDGDIWPGKNYPHLNAGMKCPVSFFYWKDKPWPIVWLNNWDNMNLINTKQLNTSPYQMGVIQCNMAYYKQHIIEMNGYDEDYIGPEWTDADIAYRFEKKGLKFRFIPGCAIWHLVHSARWDWVKRARDDVDDMFSNKKDNFQLVRNEGKDIFVNC